MKFSKFTDILGSITAMILLVVLVYIPYYRLSLYHAVYDNYLIKKPRRPPMFTNYKTKRQHFNSVKLVEKLCFAFVLVFI